jgi:outer membrane protein assembly factor BamD
LPGWCALLLIGGSSGCASDGPTKPITYGETARKNYEKGMQELADDNYPEAVQYFQRVRQKHPFSRYATLSELAIADTNFKRERYGEAIDEYRTFIKAHPTHPQVENGYVWFRIGEAYYSEVPDDWWISPPAYEKDQTPTRDALRELEVFIERFAGSRDGITKKYVKRARQYRTHCARMLAEHELAVARYYLSGVTQLKAHPQAALWRAQEALEKYGATGVEAEAMLIIGEAHLDLNQIDQAKLAFAALSKKYPNTTQGRRAGRQLDRLERRSKPSGG